MLFDSTILIDFLNGIREAREAIIRSPRPAISIITWIEVLSGARTEAAEKAAKELLSTFSLLPLTGEVAGIAVTTRRERRLKLPDAVIYATALQNQLVLVTRNTRDFPRDDPTVVVPYQL